MTESTNDTSIDRELNLALHTVMPNRDESWEAGFDAALSEMDLEENPFVDVDAEYTDWESGWWAGFYNESNLVKDVANNAQAKYIVAKINEMATGGRPSRPIDTSVSLAHKKVLTQKVIKRIKVTAFSVSAAVVGILAYAYLVEAFA